jgi:predicted metal-dependent phosphoesterase TrpH
MHVIQADLHLHSISSDGTLPPAQVVALAGRRGLLGLALTDHDTLDGIPEARRAAEAAGLDFVTGIEISCDMDGRELHLLGYLVDDENATLRRTIEESKAQRLGRGRDMVERLNALNVAIRFEDVVREARGGVVGRPHVARALVAAGSVASEEEAFRRFLRDGGPAHVPKVGLSSAEAIRVVRGAGGVAVLAHPGLYPVDELIGRLMSEGLAGIEVWHTKHSPEQSRRFGEMAARLGLVPTGGSDFHSQESGVSPGVAGVPLETIAQLREAAG